METCGSHTSVIGMLYRTDTGDTFSLWIIQHSQTTRSVSNGCLQLILLLFYMILKLRVNVKAVMPQTDIKLVECVLCGRVLSPIKEERRKRNT